MIGLIQLMIVFAFITTKNLRSIKTTEVLSAYLYIHPNLNGQIFPLVSSEIRSLCFSVVLSFLKAKGVLI